MHYKNVLVRQHREKDEKRTGTVEKRANCTETDGETRRGEGTLTRIPMETETPMQPKQKRKRRHRTKYGNRTLQTKNVNTHQNHNKTDQFIDDRLDTPYDLLLPPILDPKFKNVSNLAILHLITVEKQLLSKDLTFFPNPGPIYTADST